MRGSERVAGGTDATLGQQWIVAGVKTTRLTTRCGEGRGKGAVRGASLPATGGLFHTLPLRLSLILARARNEPLDRETNEGFIVVVSTASGDGCAGDGDGESSDGESTGPRWQACRRQPRGQREEARGGRPKRAKRGHPALRRNVRPLSRDGDEAGFARPRSERCRWLGPPHHFLGPRLIAFLKFSPSSKDESCWWLVFLRPIFPALFFLDPAFRRLRLILPTRNPSLACA